MSVRASVSPSSNDKPLPVPRYAARSSSNSPSHSAYSTPTSMDNRHSMGGGLSPNPSSSSSTSTGNNNANSSARFRSSVDAARTLYSSSNGHQSLQPGAAGMGNMGGLAGGTSPRPQSGSKRPSSEMLASFAAGNINTESGCSTLLSTHWQYRP